jgi:hypothetical protein
MNIEGPIPALIAAIFAAVFAASLVVLALPSQPSEARAEEEISSRDAAIIPVRAVRVIVASPYHR